MADTREPQAGHALWQPRCGGERVRPAHRPPYERESFGAERVGELLDVLRPTKKRCPFLRVGSSVTRPVDCDEPDAASCRCPLVKPEARAWDCMEEDWFAAPVSPFGVCQLSSIVKADNIITKGVPIPLIALGDLREKPLPPQGKRAAAPCA